MKSISKSTTNGKAKNGATTTAAPITTTLAAELVGHLGADELDAAISRAQSKLERDASRAAKPEDPRADHECGETSCGVEVGHYCTHGRERRSPLPRYSTTPSSPTGDAIADLVLEAHEWVFDAEDLAVRLLGLTAVQLDGRAEVDADPARLHDLALHLVNFQRTALCALERLAEKTDVAARVRAHKHGEPKAATT